jgi:hypothetical protein
MKNLLYALGLLLLSGCSIASIKSFKKQGRQQPYSRILVLLTDSDIHLTSLDSATYEAHIRNHFNSLDNARYTAQLERTLVRNLESKGTIIIKASDMFPVNDDISYDTFIQQLNRSNIQGVLLVSLRDYWQSGAMLVQSGQITTVSQEPNASFNCYLVDRVSNQPVWMSHVVVNGIYAGYDTLNNHMARRVSSALIRGKYIYPTLQ